MSEQNNALMAMLGQYENNTKPKPKKAVSKYDERNYFGTKLNDKQNSASKNVRILSTKDGSSPFVEVYGHTIQVDGDWKTFICLQKEKNQPCPFCEAHDVLRASSAEADKELAKKYNAKLMYIVKVIDREDENHGPKFWRFNHDYRKEGVIDKIYGVLQAIKKDITHAQTGRDLAIMIGRNANRKSVVTSITPLDQSPLSDDEAKAAAWLADEQTWEDVFGVKTYEYLEIIVKGGVPVYDKEAKKYVDSRLIGVQSETAKADTEISLGVSNVKPNVTVAATNIVEPTPAAPADDSEESEDDLPF